MSFPAAVAPATQPFRDLWARLPAAVYIVTCAGPAGPCGATVTSVCSVSLEPLIVLVCLNNRSVTLAEITRTRSFALNALRAEDSPVAQRFATRADAATKYRDLPHRLSGGVPVFDDALGWFVCSVATTQRSGDHTIVTGLVRSMGSGDGDPLLWHHRGFRGLPPEATPPDPRPSS